MSIIDGYTESQVEAELRALVIMREKAKREWLALQADCTDLRRRLDAFAMALRVTTPVNLDAGGSVLRSNR